MKDKILIIGGGTQLQCTVDIIEKENKYAIAGIVDSKADLGTFLFGYEVVGRQQELKSLVQKLNIAGGVISVGDNWIRKIIHDGSLFIFSNHLS